jgi:hypothetical protein
MGNVYIHNKGGTMSARHFTISDADLAIRSDVERLRLHLQDTQGIDMSQAKVIKWAILKALREAKVKK